MYLLQLLALLLIHGHSSVFRLDNQHSGYCLGASFWPRKYPAGVNLARGTVHGVVTPVCTCSEVALVHQKVATGSAVFSGCEARFRALHTAESTCILALALAVSRPVRNVAAGSL